MTLLAAAARLRPVLAEARKSLAPSQIEWYIYDSLANCTHLTKLFEQAAIDPVKLLADRPVLDVGCADGDFSFCLESLGGRVTAIDHPRSSQNGMQGVRELKAVLDSPLDLREIDIDRDFNLGTAQFEVAFVLGLLYHVKNPFYVLETVARHARYCVLSTRVARRFPSVSGDLANVSLAYLLSADELNADDSNFWIFSPAGLQRLIARSHWKTLASFSAGDVEGSRPNTLDHDERMFCLLESTFGLRHLELLEGWHQPEDSGWRWTESRFSARLDSVGTLRLDLFVPAALIEAFGCIRLSCDASNIEAAYIKPGLQSFTCELREPGVVTFSVSDALPAVPEDLRERALIVADLRVE